MASESEIKQRFSQVETWLDERSRRLWSSAESVTQGRGGIVQGAHHILSERGPDTDLQRFGRKLAGTGSKNGKKRAVVAVARKLAVLPPRRWVTGEKYQPLRNSDAADRAKK